MNTVTRHVAEDTNALPIFNPFDGNLVGSVETREAHEIEALMARARRGASLARGLPRHQRASILEETARIIECRRDTFANTIVMEAGKTIVQARKEVLRCVNTLKLSSDDPPFFHTSLAQEYETARSAFGLDDAALLETTRTSIEAAFVDEETRGRLLARLD